MTTVITVRELIDLLIHAGNDDALVVLAKDGEGNAFSPLAGVDTETVYVAESTWSGTVYASDEDGTETDLTNAVACVCLWSTN